MPRAQCAFGLDIAVTGQTGEIFGFQAGHPLHLHVAVAVKCKMGHDHLLPSGCGVIILGSGAAQVGVVEITLL